MVEQTRSAAAGQPLPPDSLPEWNLADLYSGPQSATLHSDLETTAQQARDFRARIAGKVASLSGSELGRAIAEYERIDEVTDRIMSYAQLVFSGDMSDPDNGGFLQSMQEKVTAISSDMLFFTLEINGLEDDALEVALEAPELAHYRPWLRDIRDFRPHQLSEDLETLLLEKSVAGRSAWIRLFDETMARLRFNIDDAEFTISEVLDRLSSRKSSERAKAAQALATVLGANVSLFTRITNTLVKDKEVEDRWRNYDQPVSSRNRVNQVEDAVVEALVDAVTTRYERLSHRYYRLKAGWFGLEQLDYWDRNAPLPDDNDHTIPWAGARDVVLDAYHAFSPRMAEIGNRFFTEGWIDAPARPGKASGAFSHPTVPSAHPYILLNYMGRTRDVMTLAHELGHGVHQVLAGRQGHFMSDTPLTLAETASVFGEMLTFQSMLKNCTTPQGRRTMLASKIEDMLNTVIRQVAFHRFETRVHADRRKGELTAEAIADIWMSIQRESLGPAIRLHDDYRVYWTYIPHFIHSPFYVYAYAFGDCLVNSLYSVYQNGAPGFEEKYLDLLSAGGTLRHRDLLAPFGLDAGDPEFWAGGLTVIETLIDTLEKDSPTS